MPCGGFSDSGADDGNESQTAANCYERLSVSAQFATGTNVSVCKSIIVFFSREDSRIRKVRLCLNCGVVGSVGFWGYIQM